LTKRISETSDPKLLRYELIADIAGLGPKQSSMFLRNIGNSYELAILDTHVLRFINMQDIFRIKHTNISNISVYERIEGFVRKYAEKVGFRVGFLDWAIWATMRAALELGL
jgi:N-glycosylase/DNA lyase